MSNEAQMYEAGFRANLGLKPQQTNTRLVHTVMADLNHTAQGKMFNADDVLSAGEEVPVTTRIPPSPDGGADYERRVGFFTAKQLGVWLENLERVRMLEDPASTVMQGVMATKNRATDDAIIAGMFGSVRYGENGENTLAYDDTNQKLAADNREFLHQAEVVAGSGDLPLTIGKLIKSKVMLDQSEIDGERYFGCGAVQLGNLLQSIPVTNSQYAQAEKLVNGETDRFMGFTFVRSERFPIASTIRTCGAWIKQAVQYKERPIKSVRIVEREDRSFRWYAYYELERGSLRHHDKGVIKVLCKE